MTDDWVELFTLERSADQHGDRQMMAIQLAVRGFDTARNVDPHDVRIDLICGRGAELRSWLTVSVRRAVYDAMGPVVLKIPLEGLAEPGTTQSLVRTRSLAVDDIKGLLRTAPVRFVVANVGHPLAWIDTSRTFDVWKSEVRPHLADPDTPASLDDFPDGYLYVASRWARREGGDEAVVLLEKQH
jgi:hypothetical protein